MNHSGKLFCLAMIAIVIPFAMVAMPTSADPKLSDAEIFQSIKFISVDEVRSHKEPFSEVLKKAKSGDVESQFRVGVDYQIGLGVDADAKKAVEWYYKAVAKNHSGAAGNLAGLLSSGTNVKPNIDEAIRLYRIAASANDRLSKLAAYNLGCVLLDRNRHDHTQRKPTEAEQEEGVKWFKQSAELGVPEAMQRLSNAYRFGIGVPVDMDEAHKWCSKAADLGVPEAQLAMGLDVFDDPKKYQEAIEWFHKAAVKGLPAAECKYGEYLLEDVKNAPEAIHWIQNAAKAGWPEAEGLLGEWLVFREGNNPIEGVKWLKKSAEQHYPKAENNLGNCYHAVRGIPMNSTLAVKWYEQAGDDGEPLGWTNAACMLLFEQHDEESGLKLLRKAADAHEPHAQYLLAKSILSRHHQDVEHEQAKQLLIAANAGGAHEAKSLLEQVTSAQPMTEEESLMSEAEALLKGRINPDPAKAVLLLTTAAERGYPPAQAKLGECYKTGVGVSKADIVQACKWYLLASRAKYKPADAPLNSLVLDASNKDYENAVQQADAFRPVTK